MKILIVDDEKIICDGLRTLVERLEISEITGIRTSYRAEHALQIAAETHLDILVTDIRMPNKSGLELIAQVRVLQPAIRPIVVTGHDDFELVREALRLEAVDYLLKPATKAELRGAILRAISDIREARATQRENDDERLRYFDSVVDAAWPWFVEGTQLTRKTIHYLETTLRARVGREHLSVMIFEDELGEHRLQATQSLSVAAPEEADPPLWRLRESDRMAVAVVGLNRPRDFEPFATGVVGAVKRVPTLFLSCAGPRRGLQALPGLYHDAELARAGKLARSGRVQRAPHPSVATFYDSRLESRAAEIAAWLIDEEGAPEAATRDQLVLDLVRAAHTPHKLVALWNEIESKLRRSVGMRRLHLPPVSDFFRPEDAVAALRQAVRPEVQQTNEEHAVVRRAKEFVDQHYHEQHTMQDVADRLGVSYAYFSTLFKQQTGETYSHYLTQIRMEHARRLLEEVRIPVSGVAAQVGYLYPKHFARAFRRYWGVSPRDYVKGKR